MPKLHANSNLAAKLELRRHFLDGMGGPVRVLDAYAGDRTIWSTLRAEYDVAAYVAIDRERKGGATLKLDNLRWLARGPLPFDVVDLDAYGEPWPQFEALVGRRDVRGPLTVFLTVGMGLKTLGGISTAALRLAGIPPAWSKRIPRGSLALRDLIVRLGLQYPTARGWSVLEAVELDVGRAFIRYFGIQLARVRAKRRRKRRARRV